MPAHQPYKFTSIQRAFNFSRFFSLITYYIQYALFSHYIYTKTQSATLLGLMSLTIFISSFLSTFISGVIVDKFSALKILYLSRSMQSTVYLLLLVIVLLDLPFMFYYIIFFLLGIAYQFDVPAENSIIADIIPEEAVKKYSSIRIFIFYSSQVVGPPLGMFLYDHMGFTFFKSLSTQNQSLLTPLFLCLVSNLFSLYLLHFIKFKPRPKPYLPFNFQSLKEGFQYVLKHRVIFEAMTLDLFAVFLGGSVTLLPIFAHDILKVSPTVYGILSATPSIGASIVCLVIARYQFAIHSGNRFYQTYIIFAIATLLFALSKTIFLTFIALIIIGSTGALMRILRTVLYQEKVPRELRGRVFSISSSFLSCSNQLGGFESGMTAKWFGAIPACIIGGVGTLIVTALHYKKSKDLKHYHS